MPRGRSLVAGALLAALLSSLSLALVTQVWRLPLHVPFQYAHTQYDDEQDETLDMMLIKNSKETGWFDSNPKLNAPFEQHWAEWPMGGDLLAYTIKKVLVDTTGDVPLTLNLFWLLTFPLTALATFPVLRSLRVSWWSAIVGAALFSLAPYHFRNGVGHENLAFYVGIPVIVLLCAQVLGPGNMLGSITDLKHWRGWWRLRWLLLGAVLVGVTGIYYLAFMVTLLVICSVVGALARRRISGVVFAGLFSGIGLAASFLANLPTLWFRWHHARNVLGVPDRQLGVSEGFPLRPVELLSPVTGHRFGAFAWLANHLYEPGREGFATANLGLAAAVGFVVALTVLLVRAVTPRERRDWSLEARLGVVVVAAILLGAKGGLSRALELTGLSGVRAWNRLAIVIAFAGVAVFGRLLDRAHVAMARRLHARSRSLWTGALVVVLVVGVLDQASPAMMPDPQGRAALWRADGTFVAALEQRLPRDAMVFQLPVTDFPQDSAAQQLPDYDLIKEGYLHSKTLRWSTAGVRGRDGEWQWPAFSLPTRAFLRGLAAIGFAAITLDRRGFDDNGDFEVRQLQRLLGPPIAIEGPRVLVWDLRPAAARLLRGASSAQRDALAQQYFDLPRLYLTSDARPITDRGDFHRTCARATLLLVNPGSHDNNARLRVTLRTNHSAADHAELTLNGRTVRISDHWTGKVVAIHIPPGRTVGQITVHTPGVRCDATPDNTLPSVAARLQLAAPVGSP